MKTRLLVVVLSAALLGVSSLGVACKSGGGAMTAEEYFQALQALNDEADQRSSDLEAALDENVDADVSEKARIVALRNFLDGNALVFDDFLSGLRDLDPPAELQAAHDDAVAAGDELLQVFTDLTKSVDGDTSLADIGEMVTDFESDASTQRFTDACFVLQDEADQREIAVDLECEDEEG